MAKIRNLSERVEVIETEEDLSMVLEDICVEHTRLAKEYLNASIARREEIKSEINCLKRAENFLKGKWDEEDYKIGSDIDDID